VRILTHLAEVLLWSAAGVGTWLLTLSSVSAPELVTAVAVAVPCAVLAVLARRALQRSWSVPASWLRWLLPLPAAVAADTAHLLALAAGVLVGRRIPDGELRRVRLPADEPGARRAARAAAVAGVVSASPGTVVLDVGEGGELLLHALGSGRPRLEEVVRR
jgi:multisubunit Na+/H+ antiporter MnhE subunit